jgi:hypothetical protein
VAGKFNKLDARVVVGTAAGARSSVWRFFSTRNDVYMSTHNMAKFEKFSFHESGLCRHAFEKKYSATKGMLDRKITSWRRKQTPPAGSGQASCVFEICFPTDYLSTALGTLKKPVIWLTVAPSHAATVLEMVFTRETEQDLQEVVLQGNRSLVFYAELPNGEGFAVLRGDASFGGENFLVPASHYENEDIVFSTADPSNTGRPLRMTLFNNPRENDRMTAWEYGGYRARRLLPGLGLSSFGTFRRDKILGRDKFN